MPWMWIELTENCCQWQNYVGGNGTSTATTLLVVEIKENINYLN